MKKSLILALLLMGFTGTIAQVVLIRELLVTFYGNELSIGIILANWLILEAVGSFFLGRIGNKTGRNVETYVALQFAIAIFLPIAVYGGTIVKGTIGIPPGEMVGLFPIFYSSLLLLAPLSLAGGAHFTIGCRIYSGLTKEKAPSIARVYVYEAVGAVIGGLLLTFLVIPYFHSIEVILAVSGLNLISAILLIAIFKKPSLTVWRVSHRLGMGFHSRGAYFLFAGVILVTAIGYALFSPKADDIHTLSAQAQWKGYDLQYYRNSNYGNIAVTERSGEFTFYSDGIPITTTPNPDETFVEELAHLPMLFHSSPQNVLVVGGGVGGLINEVVKHPVEKIDYTELDPLIIVAARKFPTPLTESELNNPKVAVHNTDGRLFMSRSRELYDVIIVNLPSPSTLQLNRFYTREFFEIAKARLSQDGILAITCPGSTSYLSAEMAALNACIYHTLNDVFSYVRAIPGESNLLLASPSEDITAIEPAALTQRLQDLAFETRLISELHIQYKLDKAKETWFLDSISKASEVRMNRDLTPYGLFYDISLWTTLASPHFEGILRLLGEAKMWMFLIPLAVLLATFLILRKRIPRIGASSVAIVIATTGFAGMAYNMVLILAFQSLYGNIYQMIAFLISAFMVGLAIGGIFMTRIMSRITNSKSILVKLELLVLAYSILLPVVLILFPSSLGQTAIFATIQAVIIILSLASGILVGSEFPLANKIRLRGTESVGEVAGGLYACDLMGAWFGALIVGVWLIPVLGIVSTCILIACLKLVSLVLIVTSRL
ncbi:spermine synthase [Chloroflexota bacterium]